jgi:hypothetical protein
MSIGRLANTMALLVVRQGRLIDPTLHIVGDQDSILLRFGVSGYLEVIHSCRPGPPRAQWCALP